MFSISSIAFSSSLAAAFFKTRFCFSTYRKAGTRAGAEEDNDARSVTETEGP
jgi:hypothetical protein